MPRELIDTGTDKRFVRRDSEGQFKESDEDRKSTRLNSSHLARSRMPSSA